MSIEEQNRIKTERYLKKPLKKRLYTLMEILDLAHSWKKANPSEYNTESLDDFLKFLEECENG